jgi:predicted O-linked N-acetylglucosamine transferase (SPINDLY family)
VSTWGADIDYVFSGLDVEVAENPERNYSERLVLLPGSGAIHNRPNYTLTGRRKDKDDAAFLINCPWNAQKVNHRFVRTLRELIRRARKPIRLRLFVSASLNLRNDYLPFVRELDSVLGAGVAEVCLGVSYGEYMSKMEEGDICLDSYHFGGCNTLADGLYLRKLTVTREGDKWYNRIGPRMVRMAGLPELATSTEEEYLDVILRLIHDDEYRAGLQTRLDRADLEGTIFDRSDARYFAKAIAYLIEHHSRLRLGADRSPIRIER